MMGPKGKLFHPEYAIELIEIAEGDLASARGLSQIKMGRPENICYLGQQCAEKCLKAVLCHLGKAVILTHDLDALLSHIPTDKIPQHAHLLGALTEYSLIRRYEKGYEILTDQDISLAIELAKLTLEWAQTICQKTS